MSISKFLQTVNGFSALGPEGVETLAEKVTIAEWAKGDRLIRRGDIGEMMHVIREGRVRIPIVDAAGVEKQVVHLGPGDLVGEMALLTGEKRSADVIAESKVITYVLDRSVILPALVENPPLAKFMTEILGKRLEETGPIKWVGKYRLLGMIGEGATSKVYQGVHPTLNRVVAIKMLSHALVYDRSFKDRFLQEGRTIAGLMHPNIVQIYDTEESWATFFIVMEKVSGTDLQKLLKAKKVMAPDEAVEILGQMADALAYAHGAGIVHRDVKPANCAVDENGVVKLMDFGIARRISKRPAAQQRAKIVEGTPRYLAPEAAVGRPVDGRADIYSLGIMAFEMVSGRVPFYSETIRELLQMHVRKKPPAIEQICEGLPEGLVKFINGALIKRPDERLTDWDEIKTLLNRGPDQVPEVRSDRMELLSVTASPDAEAAVARELDGVAARLANIEGVEVRRGSLSPVGRGSRASLDKGWFSRLRDDTLA
jgi:tRNA A-37 threonylcarbamoyl transferase component Bud32